MEAMTACDGKEFQIRMPSGKKDCWYMMVLAYGTREVMLLPLGEMVGTRIRDGISISWFTTRYIMHALYVWCSIMLNFYTDSTFNFSFLICKYKSITCGEMGIILSRISHGGITKWLSPTSLSNIWWKSKSCGHAHLHYMYKHHTKYQSYSSKTVGGDILINPVLLRTSYILYTSFFTLFLQMELHAAILL